MILESLLVATSLKILLPPIDSLFDEKTETIVDVIYLQEKPANLIADVVKPGFSFNGNLLRFSEVVVTSQDPAKKKHTVDSESPTRESRWKSLLRRH